MSKIQQAQQIKEIQFLEFEMLRKIRLYKTGAKQLCSLEIQQLQAYCQHLKKVNLNIEKKITEKITSKVDCIIS